MKNYKKPLDKRVKPMVELFNKIGLKTHMSCSGHFHLNGRKNLFWIEFDSSVNEQDLVDLWNRVSPINGWLVQRMIPGPKYNMYRWCYVAGSSWSAYFDFRKIKKEYNYELRNFNT